MAVDPNASYGRVDTTREHPPEIFLLPVNPPVFGVKADGTMALGAEPTVGSPTASVAIPGSIRTPDDMELT